MASSDPETTPEVLVHSENRKEEPELRICHFNDVYHPHHRDEEPVGGCARFQTLINYYRNEHPSKDSSKLLTFFSGDAFNPSRESSVTKGSHMVPVLNNIGIDVACVGNHEFDFGPAHFNFLAKDCNFPWLLANIFDPELGENETLGRCEKSMMLTTSNGIKVGVMGLAERQWLDKINNSLPGDVEYYDMVEVAEKIGPQLREEGADIVIALTHARQPQDFDFGDRIKAGVVDLMLAGHDHWVEHKIFDNGTHLVRSGVDFKNLSYIQAWKKKDGSGKWDFEITRRNVTSELKQDPETQEMETKMVEKIHKQLEQVIGYTAAPLDARKDYVLTQESNLGNFVADLMRLYHDADCAIINGGTIRGDQIYRTGDIHLKDMIDCFPFEDPVVVVKVKGKRVKEALENGVSKYPEKDTRFPQVSNIKFRFNPDKEPGSRVDNVEINGESLDEGKDYNVATRSHMASGKEGYSSLLIEADGGHAEEIVDEENGVLISALLRQYFSRVQIIGAMQKLSGSGQSHWGDIIGGIAEHSADGNDERKLLIMRKVMRKWHRAAGHQVDDDEAIARGEGEFTVGWKSGIAPRLEGRIQRVGA